MEENQKLNVLRNFYRPLLGVVCAVIILLISTVHSPSVLAASGSGSTITTSPVSVDLLAAPGSSTSTVLQLQNNGPQAISISVKLEEFKAVGKSGQAQIYVPPPGDPSVQWVHFSRNSFTAEPGVWNPITMTIALPKTAAYGYYYAVLFVPNTITNALSSDATKVKGANAVLVLLNAHTPNESNRLSVRSYTADKSSYQYLPASFSVDVHNSGNIFTAPRGDIYISRTKGGKVIDTIDVNSGQGNVLPGTDRIFQVQWANGFPVYQLKRLNGQIVSDKKGKPIQQLKWDIAKVPEFRYGKYYARLVLVYNNGSRDVPINGEVSFWVIPWLLLLGLLLFSILVLLGLWTIVKNIIKRLEVLKRRR